MKKLFSVLIVTLTFVCSGFSLFAENAVVTYVKGKVEVQNGNEWTPLKVGDEVSKTQIISTGFQSEAKVKLLDSVLYLGPVTRIAVEELSAAGSTDKVSVYLKTGTVRSQVNHTENKRVNYQVHTAIAVASARGTDYIVSNDETIVIEGIVAVEPYIPPVAETSVADVSDTVEEETAETESTESAVADAAVDTPAEEPAPSETKGVLVKANQSVKVSSDNGAGGATVAAPVNAVVQNVNKVVSVGTTAAAKDSVQSAAVTANTAPVVVTQPPVEVSTKGFAEITVEFVD